jgi:predicted MFS family arabinose efflux permease
LYGRKVFFQGAIVIFLVGSILAGLAQSMDELIVFRAIQGLGGGGLIVGAQASIGDIVSPRERGRLPGPVWGRLRRVERHRPSTGWALCRHPLLPLDLLYQRAHRDRGLVGDDDRPPRRRPAGPHVIDYSGATLLALGATALVLLTSLGRATYAWDSAPIIVLGVGGSVLLIIFSRVERRAREPVIPLRLFRNGTFRIAGSLGFAVGFAMFGAITYLPLYQQVVKGVSPTLSGVRLLPLVAGLLFTSVGSGRDISRWGRYKVFPIVGTALMTFGLFLLSRLTPSTGTVEASVALLVLGLGLGSIMRVVVVATQNAVNCEDLGTATSGVTFLRAIGGSFGVAVFGAIFSNVLVGNLNHFLGQGRFHRGCP